jgi:hypothetical protein
MPRYFFHASTLDGLRWDATGLELPKITRSEDPQLTLALWTEAFDQCWRTGWGKGGSSPRDNSRSVFDRRSAMMRFPMFGFSRPVEDTVARAMAILNTRPDYTARPQSSQTLVPGWTPRKPTFQREERLRDPKPVP